eukprot:CAMPEP_0206458288 /NCGR_PEP_ID=MMETSP0324_2-20121206/23476_1 /ASSEMBLY_ACC=CAM_ASM_000836 /TAXON_ID=2866 /ORGANISM="Crypthecodinium cohnii, Strain Seligo" /LENGTH=438 /DNA_ID=CAMNT_0053929589 /DNA_START=101 /DNA_END=1417 /DNA_ORIENTATION=-
MFSTPVQSDLGHMEFFHRKTGKKHVLGAHSSVDNIILGRDIDNSGHDPHKAYMSKFEGYAGARSGEKVVRPFRKPNHSSQSMVDTVVFGHDLDNSGDSPHAAAMESFKAGGAGGMQAGSTPYRPFRKPGYAMKSTMDELMYGRDIDFSGDNPHEKFTNTYSGHAGVMTENKSQRPFRKQNCTFQSQVDDLIYGHDMDGSGPSPQKNYMAENFKGYAGMKSEEKIVRPYRKPGISQQAVVDDLIQDHDVDGSGPNVQFDHFTQQFQGHAGFVSGSGQARRGSGKDKYTKTDPAAATIAGKPAVSARQQSRQVGVSGGLREEKPRWNGSTKSNVAKTPSLAGGESLANAESMAMQSSKSVPSMAFNPPKRAAASDAGESLAPSSAVPNSMTEKRSASRPGTASLPGSMTRSFTGSRSARELGATASLTSVPEAGKTIRVE